MISGIQNKRASARDDRLGIGIQNKRASTRDDRRGIGIHNKRAQFFILSAVIIASIVVSMTTVKNYVSTGDVPKKFYYYSQQLENEAGAVVDYALYNSQDSTKLKEFLDLSIDRTLQSDPNMEIFACYTDPADKNQLFCQS